MSSNPHGDEIHRATPYAWLVFALTIGLLVSDYMARQVLNAVFPLLKAEWHLTDSQLGLLAGIVPIMVGALTFPISLMADRVGRIRSIVVMAVLWSAATLLCGLAANYQQMLAARVLIGVGEAAYGSAGIAVIIAAFPREMRASLTGAFMAGGLIGQVLGVGIGGAVAATYGWRMAFNVIGVAGLALAFAYGGVVRGSRLPRPGEALDKAFKWSSLKSLFSGRGLNCAYVGSGLQLFVGGSLPAWLPTYFVRYYGLPLDRAASLAAIFLAIGGAGMILCGILSDRLVQSASGRARLSATYSLGCSVFIATAFLVDPGPIQLVMLGFGMFLAAATAGPAGAMVANATPAGLHSTAFATLTLANNAFGLAPGPIVTGWLADRIGLLGALQWLPLASITAALVFLLAQQTSPARVALAE